MLKNPDRRNNIFGIHIVLVHPNFSTAFSLKTNFQKTQILSPKIQKIIFSQYLFYTIPAFKKFLLIKHANQHEAYFKEKKISLESFFCFIITDIFYLQNTYTICK